MKFVEFKIIEVKLLQYRPLDLIGDKFLSLVSDFECALRI